MSQEQFRCHNTILLGLTGNIGSGKSSVARVFETLGCELIDADIVAKQLYYQEDVKHFVISSIGDSAYRNDIPDFTFIARIIFSDAAKYKVLIDFLKPRLKESLLEMMNEKRSVGMVIVVEAAMLFEYEMEAIFDYTICVFADTEERAKRVTLRDQCRLEDFNRREAYQWSQDIKVAKANYIINNNEEFAVIPQVEHVLISLATAQSDRNNL